MGKFKFISDQLFVIRYLAKWAAIVIPVALVTGSLVALFLWLLDLVTQFRWQHEWLLYLLPLAGVLIHFLYKQWGKSSEAGNNLIIDEIHEPSVGVPAGMAPLILVTTIITHLFGGSAGREGTAVQIGGSMASLFGKWFGLSREDVSTILMSGVAAGFGAVFGTPVTGAIFALEVLSIGRIKYDALIPCIAASVFADAVCSAWGIHHTHYEILSHQLGNPIFPSLHVNFLLLVAVILAGALFGLAGSLFAFTTHKIKEFANKLIEIKWLIPVVGGAIIIVLTTLVGTQDYLGIGVTSQHNGGISIVNAFHAQGVGACSWALKLVFTAVTLGMGFKGGEVTPLFFIGAALGNTIAALTGMPVDLFAGLGFIAVFAGATNTPLACTLMGIELFGGEYTLYYAVACFTAYYFSGHSGIYKAQKIAVPKFKMSDLFRSE